MKISIIIPVYDTMKYLEKCINSILKQNFQDIEIICVNDCSKDDSLKILENYKNNDDRIIIVNNKINVGLSQSRNNGIKVASGDYIMFLDSDDYIADGTLMDLYYKINNKNLDILFFGYNEHFIEKKYIRSVSRMEYYPHIFSGEEFFCDSQKKNKESVTSWSAIYKRKFLIDNKLKFTKGLLHEDILFYIESLMKATKVSSVEKCYYEYIRRQNSITLSNDNIQEKIWSLSKIVNIINGYRNIMSKDCEYYINNYLKERIKTVADNYKKIQYFDMSKYPLCPEVDFVIKIVGLTFYNGFFTYKLPKNIVEDIKKYKKVIIYGAGKVGQGLYELLSEYHIHTDLFVQTDCNIFNKKVTRYGIEVKVISEVEDKSNAIVLVANKKDSEEMYNNAVELGFVNVINVSEYI